MTRPGARKSSHARFAFAAGAIFAALWPGVVHAQHAYTVGPPNEFYEQHQFGPVRHDTDADRGCLGGYNSETPYATDTCLRPGGGGFTMTSTVGAAPATTDISRPIDVPKAISACWTPDLVSGGQGLAREITVRVAFSASGRPIGTPRITYVAAPDARAKADLRDSLLAGLERCAPLRFTPSFGRAIAGRPFAIRFILPARS